MENTKIEIVQVEAKKSQAGKVYWRIKTNEGWASCFLKTTADQLQEHLGSVVEVKQTVTKNGEYTNRVIKAFVKVSDGDVTHVEEEVVNAEETIIKNPLLQSKEQGVYTSYVVNIFMTLCTTLEAKDEKKRQLLMDEAIKLVKQARLAFR
jgi:hypothetical protein